MTETAAELGEHDGTHPLVLQQLLSEGEIKCGALFDRAFGPDLSVVPANHAGDDRQSYAGSLIFRVRVQPLELPEQLAAENRVESDAVVAQEIGRLAFGCCEAELDDRILPPRREFPGVSE